MKKKCQMNFIIKWQREIHAVTRKEAQRAPVSSLLQKTLIGHYVITDNQLKVHNILR